MSSSLDQQLQGDLAQRRLQQRYRQRQVIESPQQVHVQIDGQCYVSFCSNDYLGLANHPDVLQAAQEALHHYGLGSGASHLVCGHSQAHHQLELALARFTGRERVLLFSSGYMANLGVLSALAHRQDGIFEDKLNHASLLDAAMLSRASLKRFQHNDPTHLRCLLERDSSKRRLVVTDGVFSMDGDIAKLPDLIELCQARKAFLMVDDAHGFGVLGESGGGVAEQFQCSQEQLPILVGTLGKAFGTFGAFVAGSETLIETLIQFARTYIYTTAIPPAIAAATLTSLELIERESWRRSRLQQHIQLFRVAAQAHQLPLMPSSTPIQPIVIGDDQSALQAATKLKQQGILITAIRPPTVPEGSARLRITLSAAHEAQDIDRLIKALRVVLSELGVLSGD